MENEFSYNVLEELIVKARKDYEAQEPGTPEQERAAKVLLSFIEKKEQIKKDEEFRRDKDHDDYVAFEREEARKKREDEENQQKQKSEKSDRIWRRIGTGVTIVTSVVGCVGGLLLTACGLSLDYDQGNATSNTLKNLMRNLLPKNRQ